MCFCFGHLDIKIVIKGRRNVTYQITIVIPEFTQYTVKCVLGRQKHDLLPTLCSRSPGLPFHKLAQPLRRFWDRNLLSFTLNKYLQVWLWWRTQTGREKLTRTIPKKITDSESTHYLSTSTILRRQYLRRYSTLHKNINGNINLRFPFASAPLHW